MEAENNRTKDQSGAITDLTVQGEKDSKNEMTAANDVNGEEDSNSGKSDHVCELCHRVFTNKRDFVLHQYNHKEKCSYYCAFCFKTFPSEFAFKRHNKFHEKKKTKCISCRICDKEFEYVKDLEEHHRQSHLNEKLFRCKHCQATFSWRENLNKHMRMHESPATKPDHKCTKCGRAFMDNISLRLHMCDANKKSEEASKPDKPFVCKVCNKAFKFDFSYEAHMNSHEGPVAMNAFKKIHMKALEEKKKQVQEAAVKKLQTKDLTPATIVQKPLPATDLTQQPPAGDNSNPVVSTPSSNMQNTSNLQEIVLEIVNVSELPKSGATNGAQILAEGSEDNSTATVPLNELITTPTSVQTSTEMGPVEPALSSIQSPLQQDPQSQFGPNTVEDSEPKVPPDDKDYMKDMVEEKENINGQPEQNLDAKDNVSNKSEDKSIKDLACTNLFSGVAATPEPSQNDKTSSGKKPMKRPKRPLLYDYVMTEEKPFQCPECKMEFRWEISLTIHIQEHLGGTPGTTRNSRSTKNMKKKMPASPVSSKIVYRRASSDEEDDYHDADFQYEDVPITQVVEKRKRGRPRKYPNTDTSTPPVKRKRGRPPKDPYKRATNANETVVIRVTRGESNKTPSSSPSAAQVSVPVKEKAVKLQDIDNNKVNKSHSADNQDETHCNVHIPKHRLIRFYLLRQLKLSRNRGFFPCRYCSIPFSCKASLNMHILRHTGKGSYRCNFCNQKFPDHRTLVLHRLIEEKGVVQSSHQCSTCFRVCASAQGLVRHLRRHLAVAWPSSRPRAKVTE